MIRALLECCMALLLLDMFWYLDPSAPGAFRS